MMSRESFSTWAAACALSGALCGSCASPPPDGRITQSRLPDAAAFGPVAAMLDVTCGTLDCHGTAFRNLRLVGSAGLRLTPGDTPLVPLCDTADEVSQDYLSVVGLEPEAMTEVASGGDPSLLTMVRKARGTEAHKGGALWSQGDDSDTCLTSWLGGHASAAACQRALPGALPGGASNPLTQCLAGM
jgi:hypothetical protein